MTLWAFDFNPCSLAHAFEEGATRSRCGKVPLRQADPVGRSTRQPAMACRACIEHRPRVGWVARLVRWSFRASHAVRRVLRDKRMDDRA